MPDALTLAAPALPAVALYAGLNALILIWLSSVVIRRRISDRILLGDGGRKELARAIRGQANFVEYAPMTLLLILLSAVLGAPGWLIHLLGASLTLGRLLHGWHFTHADSSLKVRQWGMYLTVTPLGLAGLGLVGHGLANL